MKVNEKVIVEYFDYRRNVENKKNEKTIKNERFVLTALDRHLKHKSFKQVKEKEIAEYLNNYSDKTKDARITVLKQFYRWLYDIEKGERLPDCIRRIKRTVRSPIQYYNNLDYRERVVIEEEYQRILDNARMLMHKSMIETLYCFGCRASELLSMNATDVIYKDGLTKITVRQSKTRPREILYVGRPEYLMKWVENYQHYKGQKDKPLWTNYQKYNRYTINGLEKALRVICKRAKLRNITPHDFRHTAITNARKNGEKDTHIQTNFGLSKTSVMMGIYDHNKIKDYEEELRKRQKEFKPTYELLAKQKKTLEEKHEKDIGTLKFMVNALGIVNYNSSIYEYIDEIDRYHIKIRLDKNDPEYLDKNQKPMITHGTPASKVIRRSPEKKIKKVDLDHSKIKSTFKSP